MARLLKKRRARKQAEELSRKTAIEKLRDENRAKREAKKADMAAIGRAKRSSMTAKSEAEAKKATESSKATLKKSKNKFQNISEDLKYIDRGGVKGRASQRDKEKLYQDRVRQNQKSKFEARKSGTEFFTTIDPRTGQERKSRFPSKKSKAAPTPNNDNSEFNKAFAEERKKQGSGGEFAFKGKKYTTNLKEEENNMAKHGGALAIMIAPVKGKKMKAVKKGAHGAKVKKAPGGAAMSKMKMKMMEKGGKLKMVKGPDGKMVPFYAADGKGKMMYGGSMKKKMAMGGRMGSKEMMESMKKDDKMLKHGGKVKDKMMYGGSMKKAMYGAKMKKKAMYGAKMKKK